jgi:hypothetical protein
MDACLFFPQENETSTSQNKAIATWTYTSPNHPHVAIKNRALCYVTRANMELTLLLVSDHPFHSINRIAIVQNTIRNR